MYQVNGGNRKAQVGARMILATNHIINNDGNEDRKPELVEEFWASFVDFFDTYIAGRTLMSDGSHVYIERILDD